MPQAKPNQTIHQKSIIFYNWKLSLVSHVITIPNWLEFFLSIPILLYRKIRYGRAYRLVPLTGEKFAKVDPVDYPLIIQYNWYTRRTPQTCYAAFCRKHNGKTKTFHMHRMIMANKLNIEYSELTPNILVDHLNGHGLDNQRANLRLATPAQNSRNCSAKRNGISRYKGVCPEKRRNCWRATLTINGKHIHIGQFKSEIEAAKAYDAAAKKYHGQFARLNFPETKTDFRQKLKNFYKKFSST